MRKPRVTFEVRLFGWLIGAGAAGAAVVAFIVYDGPGDQ
jgi:hypothetical protein